MPKDNPNIKERISALEAEVRNLKDRFEDFVNNEFHHVSEKIDKIIWTIIIGFLISIILMFLSKMF